MPIGTDLAKVLCEYTQQRFKRSPLDLDAPFLLTSSGKRVLRAGAEQAFGWMRSQAKVHRHDGGRYQPRLHDLRHTAAVTRLVHWYREGLDLQPLLAQLATATLGMKLRIGVNSQSGLAHSAVVTAATSPAKA